MRLALIYALLDGAREIDRVHIQAALAVWKYCAASARFIFGDLLGNTTADAILRALRKAGASGMTRTEIHSVFGGNRRSGDISRRWNCCSRAGKRGSFTHSHRTDGRARLGLRFSRKPAPHRFQLKIMRNNAKLIPPSSAQNLRAQSQIGLNSQRAIALTKNSGSDFRRITLNSLNSHLRRGVCEGG